MLHIGGALQFQGGGGVATKDRVYHWFGIENVFWVRKYSEIFGNIQKYRKHSEIFRNIQKYSEIFRNIQKYSEIFGNICFRTRGKHCIKDQERVPVGQICAGLDFQQKKKKSA